MFIPKNLYLIRDESSASLSLNSLCTKVYTQPSVVTSRATFRVKGISNSLLQDENNRIHKMLKIDNNDTTLFFMICHLNKNNYAKLKKYKISYKISQELINLTKTDNT